LASELIAAGDHDGAMTQLREAVGDYPGARFALGTELYGEGKFDEALEQLRRLTAEPQYGNVVPAEELIGRILVSQGKLPEASVQFQHVLEMSPSNAAMHGFLADVLYAQRRFEEAIPHYQTLLAAQRYYVGLGKYGRCTGERGAPRRGDGAFQRVATLDPQSANAHRNLAQAYLQEGNAPEEPKLHAREAVRLAHAIPPPTTCWPWRSHLKKNGTARSITSGRRWSSTRPTPKRAMDWRSRSVRRILPARSGRRVDRETVP
jgi:tetratricopeptide (TPR) repeat protein